MQFHQIHVPRTGGTSLEKYGLQNGLRWKREQHKYFSQCSIPHGSIIVTSLRCPIKHHISLYSYWYQKKSPGVAEGTWQSWAVQLPFSEWLRKDCKFVHGWGAGDQGRHHLSLRPPPNLYVTFFGDGNFDQAVTNLKSIDHVLDTSRLTQQFNEEVAVKYNLPLFDVYDNTSPSFEISADDIDYIRQQRAQDFEICRMFGVKTGE